MLITGAQPTTYASVLTGLSLRIYNNMISAGAILPETAQTQTIEGTVYTETTTDLHNRIFKAKCQAWSTAKGVNDEMTANAAIAINGAQVITTYAGGVGTSGDTLTAPAYVCVGTVMTPSAVKLAGTLS
jgi:hypothetical protein